jgi:mono/diheme cytochrome c family protein
MALALAMLVSGGAATMTAAQQHPMKDGHGHEHPGELHAAAAAATQPQNPVKPTPESIAAGKAVFQQSCTVCHGPEGKGDGPAAVALNPKPTNLTAGKFHHGGSDAELFKSISNGVPGTSMVGWASLPEKDRWNLVNYVKSLSGKK